jgi:putative membrane protein
MLALVASVVKGVHVAGFWSAIFGAIIISLVGSLLTWVLPPRPRMHVEMHRFRSRL